MDYKAFTPGKLFYECMSMMNMEMVVSTLPKVDGSYQGHDRWVWRARNTQTGMDIEYLITENLSHYGSRLYEEPAYVKTEKGGGVLYPLVGGGNYDPEDPEFQTHRQEDILLAWIETPQGTPLAAYAEAVAHAPDPSLDP